MDAAVSNFINQSRINGGSALTVQEVTACQVLVDGLNLLGIWNTTPAPVIYPFVGTDRVNHSLNLYDATTFNIGFADAVGNHTTSGWLNSGILQLPVSNLTYGRNLTAGLYVNNAYAVNMMNYGDLLAANQQYFCSVLNLSGNAQLYGYGTGQTVQAANSSRLPGYWNFTINNGTNSIYRNGTAQVSATVSTANAPSGNFIRVGQNPSQSLSGATGRRYALFIFSNAITPAQQLPLYNLVQSFQTILGRNV